MLNEKERTYDVIRKQKDCVFSLRFFLQKEDGSWKNILALLKLVKKGTRNEVDYNYGRYVLGEKLLTVQEGLQIISSLFQENDEKRKLSIPDYDEFMISRRGRPRFIPSKERWAYLRDNWPMIYYGFEVCQDKKGRASERELLKEGLPYYPNTSEAAIDFFDLMAEHFSEYGAVYVAIVDYRARIESLKLSFSKVEMKLDSPEIKCRNLVIKVFAKSGSEMATLPDIYPKTESVRFDVGFQPDSLSVALLSRQDDMKIDGKEFTKWRKEEEGIIIERPEEEILSLTRAGESQNLEYKYDVTNEDQKNDFIESVVAFLNTNRGLILVGVSDDGSIVGSTKSAEDFHKMVHDNCDPPPRHVEIEERDVAGNNVIVIEVPEGDDTPYQSKRDKNFYVRHGSNDMRMERSELVSLLGKRAKELRFDV